MKERWDELTAVLAEEEKMSKLNLVLGLLAAFLSGIIVGFLICPRRHKTSYYGCNNGSYNGSSAECGDDCCDCEGGECCEECEEERCCGETKYCGSENCCCEEESEYAEEEDQSQEKKKEYVKIK